MRILEGREECRDGRRDDECFEARRREPVNEGGGGRRSKTYYRMELRVENMSEEDVAEPMAVVKEYRRTDGPGGNRYKVFYVPRVAEFSSSSSSSGSGVRGIDCGEELCLVNREAIEVGRSFEDEDLCVEFECVAAGYLTAKEIKKCNRK